MKAKHIFLKCYLGDWPIREFLKRHFSNQQGYNCHVECADPKGKCKVTTYDIALDDLFNFGSVLRSNGLKTQLV
jgi:hypothetical protein